MVPNIFRNYLGSPGKQKLSGLPYRICQCGIQAADVISIYEPWLSNKARAAVAVGSVPDEEFRVVIERGEVSWSSLRPPIQQRCAAGHRLCR